MIRSSCRMTTETPRGVALVLGRSVEALPAEAQRLFAALAAFTTLDFGRNAALALAEGLGVAEPEAAVDTLARRALLDTALAAALGEGSDRERLRLHPLLRAYAAERLNQWGEAEREAAYQIVASYYAQYASATADAARAVDEANITGALEWAHAQGQEALLVRLVSGMQQYWRDRSRIRESQRYLPWAVAAAERALGAPPAGAGAAAEAAAWQDRAHTLFWLLLNEGFAFQVTGRLDEAIHRYDRCLALAQRAGSRRNAGAALSVLGQIAQARGRLDEAEGYLQQSLLIRREVQDRRGEGVDLSTLGQIAQARGRLDEAERLPAAKPAHSPRGAGPARSLIRRSYAIGRPPISGPPSRDPVAFRAEAGRSAGGVKSCVAVHQARQRVDGARARDQVNPGSGQ